jgi:hypothetical protein
MADQRRRGFSKPVTQKQSRGIPINRPSDLEDGFLYVCDCIVPEKTKPIPVPYHTGDDEGFIGWLSKYLKVHISEVNLTNPRHKTKRL